jgi:thiol-disulfide isomerase/thioredoxin
MLSFRTAPVALVIACFLSHPQWLAATPSRYALQENSKTSKMSSADDPETQLQSAIAKAGNDRAALVRNLTDYLSRFPDAPRRAAVYRALVEACQQLQNAPCALDYAEKLIALQPDDAEMMLLAVNLLQQQGDDASLKRASGYVLRVLDRVEKASPNDKPARMSSADWKKEHEGLRVALYILQGKIERQLKNLDLARTALETSYRLQPNSVAAEQLGEIDEIQQQPAQAIQFYLDAFVLPESGPGGTVDRRELRQKLGNLWRHVHGSEQGLGDAILAAYDETSTPTKSTPVSSSNQGAKDLLDFTLSKLDGSPLQLSQFKGKTLVLSFWATWCGPCRELEPEVNTVAQSFRSNGDVNFVAVNTDEDRSRVQPFLAAEKWDLFVAYADGMDNFLRVDTLPTVIVVDRAGKIAYRSSGYGDPNFPQLLSDAIQHTLTPAN